MMTYAPWDSKSLKYDLNKKVYEQNCIIPYETNCFLVYELQKQRIYVFFKIALGRVILMKRNTQFMTTYINVQHFFCK